jgi:tRNA A37 N6-isopentenylltransferase MiaA
MLNEVVDLINAGADVDWLLSLGLEYKIIGNFVISNLRFLISNEKKSSKIKNLKLNKNLELKIKNSGEFEAMKNQLKLRSHQYAKRQLTWFRRFPEIVWEKDYQNVENRAEIFLN